jgi:hypothetical protein
MLGVSPHAGCKPVCLMYFEIQMAGVLNLEFKKAVVPRGRP